MDDWNLDENPLSDINCNITICNAQIGLQGMTNNVRFTFSGGDTPQAV